MTARLSLFFSYDKDKQISCYSLLCILIYTIYSKSVLSLQHGCTMTKYSDSVVAIHFHPYRQVQQI